MIRCLVLSSAVIAVTLMPGCNRTADRGVTVEPHAPESTSVSFDWEPVASADGSHQWIATYNVGGKTAKFRMDFGAAEVIPAKIAGQPRIRTGEGTLLPEPGSDSSILLADLQKALRAKAAPTAPQSKTSVPFTYAQLGENLSQISGGGFSANPPGGWTAIKLTFGDGDRESEIFLNTNPGLKKAQFSMKDASYGDLALAELAKAL
jgi:hypothetical protein